jgi:hypothetical protein
MSALGLLLIATVGLHVEEARGVTADEVRTLGESFGGAIRRRTGDTPIIDLGTATCQDEDRCAGQIRKRTHAAQIVFINVVGVSTRIRVVTERVDDKDVVQQATVDLKRDQSTWAAAFDGVALILFPETSPPPPVAAEPPPKEEPKEAPPSEAAKEAPKDLALSNPLPGEEAPANALTASGPTPAAGPGPLPWILIGAGAAAGTTGVIFGALSKGARDTLMNQPTAPLDRPGLQNRAVNGAIAADVLFGIAAVAGLTGAAFLVF